MSQTEFGMIIMTSLVVICSGIASGSVGLKSRPGAKNIGFFPVIIDMKAPNTGRFFHFKGIDIHFSPAHPLPVSC
ncbi:hypothetical protein PGPR2_25965 [Pseudomonas aeruginosa PGPR2]|nr:hypothetical protein PGPR2_25965 [Pseudomonas aeruginosa PGPR2]